MLNKYNNFDEISVAQQLQYNQKVHTASFRFMQVSSTHHIIVKLGTTEWICMNVAKQKPFLSYKENIIYKSASYTVVYRKR